MNAGRVSGASPTVCPFVALAEDRDRRADGPDSRNRCYAEPAARQRDLVYQSDYCYSSQFAACSIFLAWAARNAAEPAYVTEAARRAWGSGIAAPEATAEGAHAAEAWSDEPLPGSSARPPSGPLAVPAPAGVPAFPAPSVEGGLFGLPDPGSGHEEHVPGSASPDWVSASAWADARWDEHDELEDDELDEPADEEPASEAEAPDPMPDQGEALTAPKVPAAIPMRRRRREPHPLRTRGSGEWHYADPLDREPIVQRRIAVAPPILLGVLGLLVVAIVVFLLPTLLSGGGGGTAAAPSASPRASGRPLATRLPALLASPAASLAPSPQASPRIRVYRVRAGDALSTIAARFGVSVQQLQCRNRILNRNLISLDQRLEIPPQDYVCPQGWRNSTPEPEPEPS